MTPRAPETAAPAKAKAKAHPSFSEILNNAVTKPSKEGGEALEAPKQPMSTADLIQQQWELAEQARKQKELAIELERLTRSRT